MDGPRARLPLLLLVAFCLTRACQAAEAAPAAERVTFGRPAAETGQRLDQQTRVGLSLKTQIRNQAEVLDKKASKVVRNRRRVLEPALVEQGLTTAAYVRYLESNSVQDGAAAQDDPIAGKSYYCRRFGDQVQVQTRDGKTPPPEEARLVAENMQTLGLPNPLTEYLAGRTVAIGEKLSLPADIAQRLLGLGGALGEVTRFELTLQELSELHDQPCAVFSADIEAHRADASQMRLMISGPMTIETETCRAAASDLSGPIGMTQSINDPRGRLQLDSTGRITVRVSSRVANAAR